MKKKYSFYVLFMFFLCSCVSVHSTIPSTREGQHHSHNISSHTKENDFPHPSPTLKKKQTQWKNLVGKESLNPKEKELLKKIGEFFLLEDAKHLGAGKIGKKLLLMLKANTVIKGKCPDGTLAEVGPYPFMKSLSGWKFETLGSLYNWSRMEKWTGTYMAFNRDFLELGDFGGSHKYGSPFVPTNETKMFLLLTIYHEGVHAYEHVFGIIKGGFTLEWRAIEQSISFARHVKKRLLKLFSFIDRVKKIPFGMEDVLNNSYYANLKEELRRTKIIGGLDKSFFELFGGSDLLIQLTAIQRFIRSEQEYRFRLYGKKLVIKLVKNFRGISNIKAQIALANKLLELQTKYEVDFDIDWQKETVKGKGRG